MTLDAFRAVFGDREDVHLTFKANSQHYLRSWKDGAFSLPDYNNVTIITALYFEDALVNLYNQMDVMVYPTYGEGFGLIPLQALGNGMPVISTYQWAPYADHITLAVPANYIRSVWPVHPGNMLFPKFEMLKYKMELAHDNIRTLQEEAYGNAPAVHSEFSWEKIALDVTNILEKIG